MAEKRRSNFIMQGSILAMAGIISRIIGLLYRIPMLSIIGEDGMGVYNTAYNVYNILLLISSYSLPSAVSKMISAKLPLGEYKNINRIFLGSLIFGTGLGLIAAVIMVCGADFFASSVMEMPEAAMAMRALAPAVFIMGMLGVMRGFFQGHGTMVPTAVSQILEQILHVAISLLAGYYLFQRGLAQDEPGSNFHSSALGATGATIGTGAGALAALLFVGFIFLLFRKTYTKRVDRDRSGMLEPWPNVMKLIALTAFPILISATLSNIGSILDQSIYAKCVSGDYRAVWGVYTAKYIVLINVPIAISSSLSASTLPTISSALARGNVEDAMDKAAKAIRFIMLIAIPASVGLAVLGKPCFDFLFRSTDNVLAGKMLLVGSFAVMTACLSTVTVGILQGSGNFWAPIKNYIWSILIHLPLLLVSLLVFKWDILGVVVNHAVLSLISCFFNFRSLRKLFGYRQEYKKTFGITAVCSVIMGGAAYGIYRLLMMAKLGNSVSLILAVGAAILIYFAAMLLTGGVDEADLKAMPKGHLLVKAARKLHLLKGVSE